MLIAPQPNDLLPPRMSPGRKELVTTGLGAGRVWATCGQGIPQEIYWPTVGEPQTRDLGFIVAGAGWWYEVKAVARYTLSQPDPAVPLATIVHTGPAAHPYRLALDLVCDPERDTVLVAYALEDVPDARLYLMLATHLQRHPDHDADKYLSGGSDNTGWGESGRLFASGAGRSLCLAADGGYSRTSVGYFGVSDLWQDFTAHGSMQWSYDRAGPGAAVLSAELSAQSGVMVLGFGDDPGAASAAVTASLAAGVSDARNNCSAAWRKWASGGSLPPGQAGDPPELADALRLSATVIKTHQGHDGAIVAGLTIPWGDQGNQPGGYHLVWPRDAVEAAQALLALGHHDDAQQLLNYLLAQQGDDGSWRQNFFPDGTVFWHGTQLDETALPVLLAAALEQAGHPQESSVRAAMRNAVRFLARTGPLTEQDRWEEDAGGSPFSLAVTVAALVAGARYLDADEAKYALELADNWNERIEEWTYVSHSWLDGLFGVSGHYVRIGPHPALTVQIKNRADLFVPYTGVLGMEFLYLARLGLRAPDDQRIRDTLPIVEAILGCQLGSGTAYYRYSFDGYGERIDGGNYDGVSGIGRPWPLLAGERGHYALVVGNDPLPQIVAMLNMRGDGGLLPEQVWDSPPLDPNTATGIPSLPLLTAKPTLSATPLVWAHSELVKLACARAAGAPTELLDAVIDRYHASVPSSATAFWRAQAPLMEMRVDQALAVEDYQPFTLHYGHDGWQDVAEREAQPVAFGMYVAQLSADELTTWDVLDFTRRYSGGGWEGADHRVLRVPTPAPFLRAHSA